MLSWTECVGNLASILILLKQGGIMKNSYEHLVYELVYESIAYFRLYLENPQNNNKNYLFSNKSPSSYRKEFFNLLKKSHKKYTEAHNMQIATVRQCIVKASQFVRIFFCFRPKIRKRILILKRAFHLFVELVKTDQLMYNIKNLV